MTVYELNAYTSYKVSLYVIVQLRVGGLPPISKHREELKLRGEAKRF